MLSPDAIYLVRNGKPFRLPLPSDVRLLTFQIMSSAINTPLNLSLFIFASFIYAINVSSGGIGTGKGGGSGQLEQQLRKNEKLEKHGACPYNRFYTVIRWLKVPGEWEHG